MNNNFYYNKNILIIGASFGIGEALAQQLAQAGANLFLTARSKDKIVALANKLNGQNYAYSCDITNQKQVKKLCQEIENKWSKIDLIIFSAGIYEPMSLNNYSAEIAANIIAVNFTAILNFLDFFYKAAQKNALSHLAIISSAASYFGMPNSLAYGASKAALSSLTESLFYELQQYKVKVQLINPAFVKTRLTAKNNFTMPNIITADQAAKIIIRNLRKRKFEISFPLAFMTFMQIGKILPFKLRAFFLKKMVQNKEKN
ncbi:MAG: SDR family NAD(P)-dependent oxidoreductase [Rickettsiales bacterium]